MIKALKLLILTTFILASLNAYNQAVIPSSTDSIINICINNVNPDSIEQRIRELENFGSRFTILPNRKDIALHIQEKFLQAGIDSVYLDSFLLDYTYNGQPFTQWQYNVIAVYPGAANPDIEFIVGAHYDSVSDNDPISDAPGADDNASGTAAILEIARILKSTNYQPQSTIKFIAFSAEEIGLKGSEYQAAKAATEQNNIKLMLNFDMIASYHTNWELKIRYFPLSVNLVGIAQLISENYSSFNPHFFTNTYNSDDASYYFNGFPTLYFQEFDFSPHYHSGNDTIENYNMNYASEIIQVGIGTLIYSISHPPVSQFQAQSKNDFAYLKWQHNSENHIAGYNLYRSDSLMGNYIQINSSIISDNFYYDYNVNQMDKYYYYAVSIDINSNEGPYSNIDSVYILPSNNEILIVDDSENEILSPSDQEVDDFYSYIFSNFSISHYDAVSAGSPSFDDISNFSTVFWHTNKFSTNSHFFNNQDIISSYLKNGGNLIVTADLFARTVDHQYVLTKSFENGDFMYDYLDIDFKTMSTTSKFFSAAPENNYPLLEIDTNKTLANNQHHLMYIESIQSAGNTSNNIYNYGTLYDPLTSDGESADLPIGVSNRTIIFNTICLSFPLYYIKSNQAKEFIEYAMNSIMNIEEITKNSSHDYYYNLYPNPSKDYIIVDFKNAPKDIFRIEVFNQNGMLMKMTNNIRSTHHKIDTKNWPEGLYICKVNINNQVIAKRFIIIK